MGLPYFSVKSDLPLSGINFEDLLVRLRAYIRLRINSGEYTERSLARILGISQPHLHNVIKGARRLNVAIANSVLIKFKISILDLITIEEVWNCLDEKDPEWLSAAKLRKPPAQSGPRTVWRRTRTGA